MKVPISKIIAEPADNTCREEMSRMNPNDCISIAKSIEVHGQLQPVLVKQEGDMYRLAAGFRRYVAIAIVLGWDEIEVKVIGADVDSKKINAIENLQRNDLTLWEEIALLREVYPPDTQMKQIERDMGMSKQWANVRWKAWNLPEEVKGQIEAGLLGFTDIQMLVQKGVDAETAAAKIIAGKAAGKNCKDLLKEVVNRTKTRTKKEVQQVMTHCLKHERMEAVQALRFAIGEIEERTFKNWLDRNK